MGERQSSPGASPSPDPRGIVALDEAGCRALLGRQRMCVMAVVDGDEPYAVPLFFGFDGETMYLGISEGRKTRALDARPRACIVVTEVGPGDDWASVHVAGTVTVLADAGDRRRAIEVLVAHNRRAERLTPDGAPPPPPPPPRTGGRLLRIDDAVITGRARRQHGTA